MSFSVALRFFFHWMCAMFQRLIRGLQHQQDARPTISNAGMSRESFENRSDL
jgi:hypothetical protein